MIPKLFLVMAAANGMLAVILGAFGAHALKARLNDAMLMTWQTAVQYHFIHTLALLALALLCLHVLRGPLLIVSGGLFLAGIALFSGSLYWLALGGPRWLGPITPLGGLCFIGGWLCLLIVALRYAP